VISGVAVQIAEYSSQWPLMFEAESHLLRSVFLPEIVEIEHIGSTAVVGMAAKPIIDMLLGASSLGSIERQIQTLTSHGYRYVPAFEDQLPQRRYFVNPAQGEAQFHLHAVESASQFWRDHLAFRDALRTDRRVFDGYLTLKRSLAESLKMDRDSYTEAKAPFIEAVINGQSRRA
jgi:GrpB-like predicted nucleotidyltransferase (UPF0157 family)